MNSRERVMTAMRRKEPDRVPFDFSLGFAPAILEEFRRRTGQSDPNDYFGSDARSVGIGPTKLRTDFTGYFDSLPPRARIDEWGIGHLPTESTERGHSHLEGFVYPMLKLRTRKDALDYPLPDIEAEYRYEHLPKQIASFHNRGLPVSGMMHCTIFEVAWYMRSMEQLLMDFVDNAEFAETLLDRILSKRVIQAQRYAELGLDIIQMGDDVASQRGMLMSVSMWRRWLKPRLARVIAAARTVRPDILIFYHSDGNVTEIVPDLIEIGVDILNPVQSECMDVVTLKRLYGDHLSFWGTIGTQTTLPFGTPEDVRREVKTRVETVGVGGGLLLAPTHMIEPDVPWENVVALVEAVEEFGYYGSGK
ncbi:MAG TPA: uroporphyrinogen decarboxylase family protein [Chthonomonadales bacterium]|nr:uroporphyrinogen decarboxylase family protein [Chthonomonadales bacterium]